MVSLHVASALNASCANDSRTTLKKHLKRSMKRMTPGNNEHQACRNPIAIGVEEFENRVAPDELVKRWKMSTPLLRVGKKWLPLG